MEKTCDSRYWTGLTLFSIDVRQTQRSKRPKHLLHSPMYQNEGRVAYKGQLFSAPMDWASMVEQMKKLEAGSLHIALPVTGAVLANRVRVVVTSGLVGLNGLLKEATVRRNVVVELVSMHKAANQPG
eukprot:4065222-Pyramimonas_sp.AAC.1